MAILKMMRLTMIAHTENRERILKDLQRLEAVELITPRLDDLPPARNAPTLAELEQRLADIREAIAFILEYDKTKTSFLTPKPPITIAGLCKMEASLTDTEEIVRKIKSFTENINSNKLKKQRLKNRISQIEPYLKFDAPLESIGESRYTRSFLGAVPAESLDKLQKLQDSFSDSAYFETVDTAPGFAAVFAVAGKTVQDELLSELKSIGFAEAYAQGLIGKPENIVAGYEAELAALEEESQGFGQAGVGFIEHKPLLKAMEDYLTNEIARECSIEKLGETGTAFLLEGWLVEDDQEKVRQTILGAAPEAYIAFRAPGEDETPPTAVKNKKLVEPFEAITGMYSHPSSRGFDPNTIMSVFYFLLFGMMIGDFAYGVILSIGAFVVLKLKKPTGMFRKVTTIIMYGGISTALWGLFFGSIFSIEGIPAVINPIQDAMTLLMLCLGFGIVHIITGLVVGAYISIKRGKVLDALFDKISWIMVLTGGVLVALGGLASTIGTYMAIAGLITVFLTNGRDRKGIFRKFIGGFSGVYGATGYISDILSYCRLFGMGLATGVIAMVFNTIAGLFFGNVVGYIVSAVILTVGHVFNIAINTLGAFVHTARLQFIEFYSRFYEGGGHAFTPLGYRTRNFRLED